MRLAFFLSSFALLFASAPTDAIAQSCEVTSGSLSLCSPPNKVLTWTGDSFEGVGSSYDIVGCYAAVYGHWSPPTSYSPGPSIGENHATENPGSSTGSDVRNVPRIGPNGRALQGVHVWYEYGYWQYSGSYWYWSSSGQLCSWTWIPNPGGTCFSAGTHLLTTEGSKPIEELVAGDLILSSPRDNPAAVPAAQSITQIVASREKLFDVLVGGQTIHTTAEHPVYAKNRGWVPAASLAVGNLLRSHNDHWLQVESIAVGDESPVYNVVVDGNSAYFVGHSDWGFSVCVADGCSELDPSSKWLQKPSGRQAARWQSPFFNGEFSFLKTTAADTALVMIKTNMLQSELTSAARQLAQN